LSGDPRFFYDTIHFRNMTGDMVLGRIFAAETVYVPESFGRYATAENETDIQQVIERLLNA
jgi:hypothetical protein